MVTDSYIDTSNQLYAEIGYVSAGTFSVIDMNAGEEVYQAYAELIKEALPKIIEKPGYLASLTGAANRSVFSREIPTEFTTLSTWVCLWIICGNLSSKPDKL